MSFNPEDMTAKEMKKYALEELGVEIASSIQNRADIISKIQEVIDRENIKADILFDGNSVWSKKKILRDIKRVKKQGMEKLTSPGTR